MIANQPRPKSNVNLLVATRWQRQTTVTAAVATAAAAATTDAAATTKAGAAAAADDSEAADDAESAAAGADADAVTEGVVIPGAAAATVSRRIYDARQRLTEILNGL